MCGVAGAFGVPNCLDVTIKMLRAMQYRGPQSSGVAVADRGREILYERSLGKVPYLTQKISQSAISNRDFFAGIGHVRYGTSGSRNSLENAHPVYGAKDSWEIYLAHNGDSPFYSEMKRDLLRRGMMFHSSSDTECMVKYIGLAEASDPIESVYSGLQNYRGAFSVTALLKSEDGIHLIAARDPWEIRPLSLGTFGDGYLVASEDTAFEIVGGKFLREIERGEVLIISEKGIESRVLPNKANPKLHRCIFELIYIAFPGSTVFGIQVAEYREELGAILARKFGHLIKEEDIIVPVPDSSISFTDGFCKELQRFAERALIRRHSYDDRSFLQHNQEARESIVREKHGIIGKKVKGKRVVLTEDSVMRGTTARRISRALRAAGARSVGVVSCAPPSIGPCYNGVDIGEDLIARKYLSSDNVPDVEKVREAIELDFLWYGDIADHYQALRALKSSGANHCFDCFMNKESIWSNGDSKAP